MKVGCWEEGSSIIEKKDGTAKAEQFNACIFVATLHFLTCRETEPCMCLGDVGFETKRGCHVQNFLREGRFDRINLNL